ncbi:MAG: ABC transporter permease, partial [Casimicrobiaceae bacterium]
MATSLPAPPSLRARMASAWDGDVAYSFRHSPVAMASLAVFLACVIAALFAPWIAPHNPFDLRTLNLSDSRLPPLWIEGGKAMFALGT